MRTQVWSCGGGTQSAAIGALIVSGDLPKPDLALIVDTGREKSSTWRYFDQVLYPALKSVGVEIHRVSKSKYATVDLWAGNGDVLLPVFTEAGKLPTYCSNEWKRRVAMRWIRTQGVSQCDSWLGISTDEMSRIRISREQWIQHKFPLIELGLSRDKCVEQVTFMGWPAPPRSSCYMCPNQSGAEWKELREKDPDDYAKAARMQDMLQEFDAGLFLRKERTSLFNILESDAPADHSGCDSGYCFV